MQVVRVKARIGRILRGPRPLTRAQKARLATELALLGRLEGMLTVRNF